MALGAWNLPPAMHRLTYLVVGVTAVCPLCIATPGMPAFVPPVNAFARLQAAAGGSAKA